MIRDPVSSHGEAAGWMSRQDWAMPALFLIGRAALLLALPIEGLRGYGDLPHFYELSQLGMPYFDYWVEFPPTFPLIARILGLLAGARQHVFDYLLLGLLSLAQAANLLLFIRIANRVWTPDSSRIRGWTYFVFLTTIAYGWWYFDSLAVLAMLLGLLLMLRGRPGSAGLALGLGMLTKWFPGLLIPLAFKRMLSRQALVLTLTALGMAAVVIGGLFLLSPEMTAASLASQVGKGSWETVWALMDGNLKTGNFGPDADRLDPRSATAVLRNPPVVSPLITLGIFGVLGAIILFRAETSTARQAIAAFGVTWCVFLLWSPGWSPQWVLYLVPLILLSLDLRLAIMLAVNFVFISLLEWPLLLSRGRFDLLWIPVIVRTALLVLLGVEFGRLCLGRAEMKVQRGAA